MRTPKISVFGRSSQTRWYKNFFHGSPALVRDLCVRGGGRQPRGNRHPFSFTPYLLPFPQKENPFWEGNCSGRLRTNTSSRGKESSSRALLTLCPHRCIPVSFFQGNELRCCRRWPLLLNKSLARSSNGSQSFAHSDVLCPICFFHSFGGNHTHPLWADE